MIFNKYITCGFLLGYALALAGCDNQEMADLQAYVDKVKKQQKSYIEPLPEVKQPETFTFNDDGLRDPFMPTDRLKSAEIDKAISSISPDLSRRKEELEAYPLDSLRMVGTLTNKNLLKGLIKANDGKIFSVTAGNYMGHNYGKIIRITNAKVELIELVPDGNGGWQERQAVIALSD